MIFVGYARIVPAFCLAAAFWRSNPGQHQPDPAGHYPAAWFEETATSVGQCFDDAVIYPEITDVIADDDINHFWQDHPGRMITNAGVAVAKTRATQALPGNFNRVRSVDPPYSRGARLKAHQSKYPETAANVGDKITRPNRMANCFAESLKAPLVREIAVMLFQRCQQNRGPMILIEKRLDHCRSIPSKL